MHVRCDGHRACSTELTILYWVKPIRHLRWVVTSPRSYPLQFSIELSWNLLAYTLTSSLNGCLQFSIELSPSGPWALPQSSRALQFSIELSPGWEPSPRCLGYVDLQFSIELSRRLQAATLRAGRQGSLQFSIELSAKDLEDVLDIIVAKLLQFSIELSIGEREAIDAIASLALKLTILYWVKLVWFPFGSE